MAEFEQNNWGWQWRQAQQRLHEWLEAWLGSSSLPRGQVPRWSLPDWFSGSMLGLAVLLLALVLVKLGLRLWSIWRARRDRRSVVAQSAKVQTTEQTVAAWLRRSQMFQQQGNYREACRCLYMALLQRLHDLKLVPHQTSRTDGEYLRLLQTSSRLSAAQVLFKTHEQAYFGAESLSATTVEDCQQAFEQVSSSEQIHSTKSESS